MPWWSPPLPAAWGCVGWLLAAYATPATASTTIATNNAMIRFAPFVGAKTFFSASPHLPEPRSQNRTDHLLSWEVVAGCATGSARLLSSAHTQDELLGLYSWLYSPSPGAYSSDGSSRVKALLACAELLRTPIPGVG